MRLHLPKVHPNYDLTSIGAKVNTVSRQAVKSVGIRELKNRLSEYLRKVRAGQTIVITDRGEPVAQLGPPAAGSPDPDFPPEWIALAREGKITLGGRNRPELYPLLPPLVPPGTSAKLLDEERGER